MAQHDDDHDVDADFGDQDLTLTNQFLVNIKYVYDVWDYANRIYKFSSWVQALAKFELLI